MAEDEGNRNRELNTMTLSNATPTPPCRLTLEIPLFFVMAGVALSEAASSNILLFRACEHSLGYTKEECKVFLSLDSNNHTSLEKEVQRYMTTVSAVGSVMVAFVPAVLSMFLGVWSDTYGRKPLIIWPLFGMTISSMLLVVYCMFENLGPWWYILTIVPKSLCGGFAILFTGALCFMNDVTTPKKRTLRITILQSSASAGTILGTLFSVPLIRQVGLTWLMITASACHVLAYAFTNVFVMESLSGAVKGGISSVLDFLLVKEMVRECFKKRPNNGRAQLLLLTLANSLPVLILYGLASLDYMYVREKLHWTLSDFTLFSVMSILIESIGAGLAILILQYLLGMGDLMVSNIAFISTLGEYIIRIYAVDTWHMYLGTGVGLLNGISGALIKSFLTKILPIMDVSKAIALVSAIEGMCPLIAPIIYNSLYSVSLMTFPGAIYALTCGLIGISIICVVVVQFLRRNMTSPYQQLESSA